MNEKQKATLAGTVCFLAAFIPHRTGFATESETAPTGWEPGFVQGSAHYQNNEPDKAIAAFKGALASCFPELTPGQANESESTLVSLFDDEETAARARYQLGLIYDSRGELDRAATLFRDSLTILSNGQARYLGYKDGCKSCHFKEWKSWKDTKMANAFDALKPGASPEIKAKFKLDPAKDYTQDPNCLPCHTTGFGLPGGYAVPTNAPYKVRKAAEQTSGCTCEVCHGPGSRYAPVHKDVEEKARPYTQDEFYAVGENRVNDRICTRCHNRRSPTVGPDYHFDFKDFKDKDTHENFPLKYRLQKQSSSTETRAPNQGSHP
jgi:tetratricopeptide (TPR) repeat protein